VIAVHCKAGKGRTGLMVSSLLVFLEEEGIKNDVEAINFYDKMRTKNGKGLTIGSQIRYVNSFYLFLKNNVKTPFLKNSILKH